MKHLLLTTIAAVVLVGCGPKVDIWTATKKGNIEAVKQHLTAGTDVDAKSDGKYGWTPLLHAAWFGHKEIAELLIAGSAEVNAKDNYGKTPLHRAVQEGYMEIVELLIAKGADVNATNMYRITPLDVAEEFNLSELASILRKHGGKTGEELKAEGK